MENNKNDNKQQPNENVENTERSEINRLKAENEALNKQLLMMQKRLRGAETVANSAKKQLGDKNNELLKAKEELRRVNEELKTLKGDQALQYLTEQIEMYKEETERKDKKIAELLKDCNFLLGRKRINEAEIESLKKENWELRNKNGEAEINTLKQNVSNLEEQNKQLAEKITPGYEVKDACIQYDPSDFDPFSLFNPENRNFLENYNKIENRKNDNIIDLSEGEEERKGV